MIAPLKLLLPFLVLCTSACSVLFPPSLPEEPPPLADMEEPLELFEVPDDEGLRRELPYGCFTGLETAESWTSLDEAAEGGSGITVKKVVENSPADIAGLRRDDILLAAQDVAGKRHELSWPSQWRKLELAAQPGSELRIFFDRAGVDREAVITVIPRVRPPGRSPVERFREEDRIGVVLRTATEVEARGHGLGPGGGAVIVGLSRSSPWRSAGLRYGDLIVAVEGEPVDHPQVVLDGIREAEGELEIEIVRGGERHEVDAAVSKRASEMTRYTIPLIFEYEKIRDEKELWLLLGIVRHRTTAAAWEWRVLWLFRFRGGDADRLKEVDVP